MKKLLNVLLFLTIVISSCKADISKHPAMYQLIERILPGKSSEFVIEDLDVKDGKDAFELSSNNRKITIWKEI